MKKELPIYRLVVSENDEDQSEVNYVALVDEPAIEQVWMKFSKSKQRFQAMDSERKIIAGPLMIADLPILRRDIQRGEYYVFFDKPTIQTITEKLYRKGFTNNVNLMHDENKKADGVYMIGSFIIDDHIGIQRPRGYENLTDGSLFGIYKVDNQAIWDEFITTGIFKGFSVEGVFQYEFEETEDEKTIKEIIAAING